MTTTRHPEATIVTLVDCPLGDHPARLDEVLDAIECDSCRVRLELAPEPGLPAEPEHRLPRAA